MDWANELLDYEQAIATFENDGDEWELRAALDALSFDDSEIAWHVSQPGRRMRIGYASL